jgi:hypothetical protein
MMFTKLHVTTSLPARDFRVVMPESLRTLDFEMLLLRRPQGLRFVQCLGPPSYSRALSPFYARTPRSRASSMFAQTGNAKWRPSLDVSLGLLGSGLLGYLLATWNTKALSPDSDVADQRPRYGSTEDFKQAIADLKSAFSDNVVSIDLDVLYAHGFSVNDYHPGIQIVYCCFVEIKPA